MSSRRSFDIRLMRITNLNTRTSKNDVMLNTGDMNASRMEMIELITGVINR